MSSLQLTPHDADAFEQALRILEQPVWVPYPWQTCPTPVAVQGVFLIEGGRGIGKTDGCTHYMLNHVNGPACDPRVPGGHRMAIVAPTLDDAAESCVTGPSGLRTYQPGIQLRTTLGGSKAVWPGGAEAKLFSGATEKDADRLRAGGNRCLVWVEEAATIPWLDTVIKQARYGLRLGPHPHMVASSTPRPTAAYKELRSDPDTIRTHGTTEQAAHLSAAVRDRLYSDYADTRLGRQELQGELLEDVEGALWTFNIIRNVKRSPDLDRIVIAIDPSATKGGDETGIIVEGRAVRDLYVLEDLTGHYSPAGWGLAAVTAYIEWSADAIVYETNMGGEMVRATIEQAWKQLIADGLARGAAPHLVPVHASRGKRVRAEPIAAIYEQGRGYHVGDLGLLEAELTGWVPGAASPNRLDALVHGATALYAVTSAGASYEVA